MNGNNLSASDVLALSRENNGFLEGNGILIILFFLVFFGGLGGNSVMNGGYQVPATKDFVSNEFNTQSITNRLNGIENGLCDGFYAINNSIKDNGFATRQAINDIGYNLQNCCCQTQRAIDNVNFNNAKNTCDIINAGNSNTQRIIDTMNQYAMEQKDIKIAEQAQLLSEQRITSTIQSSLQPPRPIPAYQVPSPYANYNYGLGNCGCGSLY